MPIAQIEYDRRLERLNLFLERIQHGAFRAGQTYRADDTDSNIIRDFASLETLLNSIAEAGDLGYTDWAANTAVNKSEIVNIGGALLIAITAGTTGATQPAVPANVGDTVADGSVTWERIYDAPLKAWDDEFTAALADWDLRGTDYEHYNCLRPPRIWCSGMSVSVGDIVRIRQHQSADVIETYYIPYKSDIDCSDFHLTGSCTTAPKPITVTRYGTDYQTLIAYLRVSAAGTLGTTEPDLTTKTDFTYDEIAAHDGSAELRYIHIHEVTAGSTYTPPTLTGFPEKRFPSCY